MPVLSHSWQLDNGPVADTETTTDAVGSSSLTLSTVGADLLDVGPTSAFPNAGRGLLFDYAESQLLSLTGASDSMVPQATGGRSYEAVFRVDDLSGPRVIAAGGKGIALPRFQLIILNSGAIRGMASLSSTLYNQQSSSGTITVGTWCHFVMVVPDPIADVELYLDGELLTTSTSAIGLNPDNGMSIGARDQGGLINPFDGPISLFNIWDAPLTASEVAAQYQALKAGDRRSVDRSIGRSVSRFAS